MKKIIIAIMFCMTLLFIITGCGKEEDKFEHYSLKDKDINSYIYYSEERGKEEYVLADITPSPYESFLTGLFYKVDVDDYILLETLEFNQKDSYKKNNVYQFYDNKLYGVGNGNTPMIFEIEFKGKDSKIKNIEFNCDGKINPFLITSIIEIKNDNILYSGYGSENGHTVSIKINCSLLDNECTTINK